MTNRRRIVAASLLACGLPLPALAADPAAATVATVVSAPSVNASVTAGTMTTTPPSVEALRARLDELQRANSAQQDEIARLRDALGALTPHAAAPATTTTAAVSAPLPAAPAEQNLKHPATDTSVQSVYREQNALIDQRWTFTPSITETYGDNRYFTLNGFLALGAIFLGNVNVTQEKSDVQIAQFDASYGVNDRLRLEASVPFYHRSTVFSSVGANDSSSVPSEDNVSGTGLGDVQLGAYYQLRRESDSTPAIVLNGHVSLPTGSSPFGIKLATDTTNNNLQYPTRLPTGSGVMGYEIGASFVRTTDPGIFFGGINWYHNASGHFNDISTDDSTVVPGTVLPGDAVQFQVGTAFALNEKTSLAFSFSDTRTAPLRLEPDHQPVQPVVGSGTNAAMLNISTSYSANRHRTVVTQIGIGLTKDAPSFDFGMRFPNQF